MENKTGIKEYDKLPSKVGFKDVDALRISYLIAKKRLDIAKHALDKIVERLK